MVEFAMIVTPLFALLIAIFQVSLTYFAQETLETTADQSFRPLITGNAQNGNMTQAQFKALVCTKLPSFLSCANVMVDVQSASDFSSASTNVPALTFDHAGNITNTWSYQPGSAGQITVARVMYAWDVSGGLMGFNLATISGARKLLMATSVFKVEPYPT